MQQIHQDVIHSPGEWRKARSAPGRPAAPLVAQLGSSHRPLVEAHLRSLPPADRYMRFGHAISDESISVYVRRLRFARDATFGAFDDIGRLLGFGHLAFEHDAAEFAVSVEPDARRQGLGLALLHRARAHVRNRGYALLVMIYMPENRALAALARRAGMQMACDPAECRAYLQLEPATPESVLREGWHEAIAAIDLGFRLGAPSAPVTSA